MITQLDPVLTRPEIAGRLSLADRHLRKAGWRNSNRKHFLKAVKHRDKAMRLAERWRAEHPGRMEAPHA